MRIYFIILCHIHLSHFHEGAIGCSSLEKKFDNFFYQPLCRIQTYLLTAEHNSLSGCKPFSYSLFQKKRNFFKVAFLLEKSIYQ